MVQLFANSGDPDETPRYAASDLGLHFLPFTLLGVSRLQWVNIVLISPQAGFTVQSVVMCDFRGWAHRFTF